MVTVCWIRVRWTRKNRMIHGATNLKEAAVT
jgi:hypothetical protein